MTMHIGKDFTPPDVPGKVTGEIKYAEDHKREGMVFARILTSPMPSGRVVNIDTSAALRMDGVVGIITANDLPPVPPPGNPALASDYVTFVGQPILAVAAVTEEIAETALSRIRVDFERRNFVVDPLVSLSPGGATAYPEGNALVRTTEEGPEGAPIVGAQIQDIKWPRAAIDNLRAGREPADGKFTQEWAYGDIEAGFADSAVVVEEPFVTMGYPHHSLESRTCMAYWENGKCYFAGSSQSQSANDLGLARMLNIDPANLVFINEATGGGFGSKIGPYPYMAITGNLSRMLNRPVQTRITREQEFYIGSARSGMQGWIKVGVKANGKVAAVDLVIVNDAGANGGGSGNSSAQHVTVAYQPESMRFRGIEVYTNTTPRGAQRGPGQNEMASVLSPIMDKAARQLGMDRIAFRRVNAINSDGFQGGSRGPVTSAFVNEALDQGARLFGWQEKMNQPKRNGSKVRGVGVGIGFHGAGSRGYDGLVRIAPDGKVHIHSGVGNLGTYSYAATSRAAAEALQVPWENCEIHRGRTDEHLPHSSGQGGSNTIFTHSRANWVAAQDAIAKLKEIAAAELGGSADDYEIGGERVFRSSNPSQGLSYADAAQRAIAMGGKYSGMEYPDDINPITQRAVEGLQGTGLVGVARDNIPGQGTPPGIQVGFCEIELDLDTGKFKILDYAMVADCGTVVHPKNFENAMRGGAVWGVGLSTLERHVYDPQNGLPANVGLYQSKPPTYKDVALDTKIAAVNIPDPQNPVGGRGIGEPTQGASASALASAISDALDGHLFNTSPTTTDMIINHLAGNTYSSKTLKTNTF
ncbi:MAG: xanthine dehydrogenase family protein molybdopterin-binding subunit [Gammaproteobacteria bacterium]|nr:xanthine dehydrogenase family protein molybdopterin-binding subunit [Pseudomonadales bacterium]MCP5346896.1 xanthine dehydrogenase family protein molybdopterin-binding subunit [Pseudomonadales bacterium]